MLLEESGSNAGPGGATGLWSPAGKPWVQAVYRADQGVEDYEGNTASSGDFIGRILDQSGNERHAVKSATSGRELIWTAADPRAGGRPSFGQANEWGNHHLVLPAMSVGGYYGVFSYRTGVETTFTADAGLLSSVGTTLNKPRIVGAAGTATFVQAGDEFLSSFTLNGNASTTTLLPMPRKVFAGRFQLSTPRYGQWYLGGTIDNRTWAGAQELVVLTTGLETADEQDKLVGWLAHAAGLQANLVAGHPYRSAPPTDAPPPGPDATTIWNDWRATVTVQHEMDARKPTGSPANDQAITTWPNTGLDSGTPFTGSGATYKANTAPHTGPSLSFNNGILTANGALVSNPLLIMAVFNRTGGDAASRVFSTADSVNRYAFFPNTNGKFWLFALDSGDWIDLNVSVDTARHRVAVYAKGAGSSVLIDDVVVWTGTLSRNLKGLRLAADSNTNRRMIGQIAYAGVFTGLSSLDHVKAGLTALNGYTGGVVSPTNAPPLVSAGSDQVVTEGDTVALTAIASDPGGAIVSYVWKNASNTTIGTTATVNFASNTVGVQTYTVTVTDNGGLTAADSVQVTTSAAAPPSGDWGFTTAVSGLQNLEPVGNSQATINDHGNSHIRLDEQPVALRFALPETYTVTRIGWQRRANPPGGGGSYSKGTGGTFDCGVFALDGGGSPTGPPLISWVYVPDLLNGALRPGAGNGSDYVFETVSPTVLAAGNYALVIDNQDPNSLDNWVSHNGVVWWRFEVGLQNYDLADPARGVDRLLRRVNGVWGPAGQVSGISTSAHWYPMHWIEESSTKRIGGRIQYGEGHTSQDPITSTSLIRYLITPKRTITNAEMHVLIGCAVGGAPLKIAIDGANLPDLTLPVYPDPPPNEMHRRGEEHFTWRKVAVPAGTVVAGQQRVITFQTTGAAHYRLSVGSVLPPIANLDQNWSGEMERFVNGSWTGWSSGTNNNTSVVKASLFFIESGAL